MSEMTAQRIAAALEKIAGRALGVIIALYLIAAQLLILNLSHHH